MHHALRLLCSALLATPLVAQVDYDERGNPWNRRAHEGPDSVVPGWFYNLGPTGMRARLEAERPSELLVKFVFRDSPADGRVREGDRIVGVGGERLVTPHVDGYGMEVFATRGPLHDFADALEECLADDGRLRLDILREDEPVSVVLKMGRSHGVLAPSFPADCELSERQLAVLLDYVAEHQREDGSWGSEPQNTFAPLALLASEEKRYLPNVERAARWHADHTDTEGDGSLVNWKYMGAAIVLSEYQLATGEDWVLPELEEIYTFLHASQFTDHAQIDPGSPLSHPNDQPRSPLDRHGGWGHRPGFEGYGPIAMTTAQGALAFALMQRCGVDVERKRHEAAYEYLARGTGRNGYTWYADSVAGHDNWADHGRTGASAMAHWLSPYEDGPHLARALRQANLIGEHPESFPDTHASPLMGMGWVALGASIDPASFRRLMDANRWWFVLAESHDGTFCYQPNRDNAGYGRDSRLQASATTALILTIPRRSLVMTAR